MAYFSKTEMFRQALINVLVGYKVSWDEAIRLTENVSHGTNLLDCVKLCDIKAYADKNIANKKAASYDWENGLRSLISDYEDSLNDTWVKIGYNEALNCKYQCIELARVDGYDNEYGGFFPVYEHFLGVEIAYILPKLKAELKSIIQNVTDSTKPNFEIDKNKVETTLSTDKKENKIVWLGTNTQLAYLFKALQQNKLIDENAKVWSALEGIFISKSGTEIKNLAQSTNNLKLNKTNTENKPKRYEIINTIIRGTKNKP